MYKVISFDIGGTLIKETNNPEMKKYDLKSLASLVNLPYEIVRIAYKDVYQKTNGTFDELINDFCNRLGIEVKDEYVTFFKEKFELSNSNATISEEDTEIIRTLKENGYKIILVSNSCCLLNNNISNEIISLIDGLFYSYNLGYTKSDKELYEYIENTIGYSGNEILHIGDTLGSDYKDPIKNGWDAIYFGIPKEDGISYITNLRELYNILNIGIIKK